MEIWPNFFIVGAPRSGTTSLYEYLKQVKGIYMSPIKEPNYFSISISEKNKLSKPIRNRKKYLKLFKNLTNEAVIGEASPTYLWDPKAPKLIHDVVPHAKIIMILRDPTERSFSHYLNGLGLGYEILPFIEAMKEALGKKNDYTGRIATASFYYESVLRYFNIFNHNQIKILVFEEFIKDTKKIVKDVLNFLGINEDPPNSIQKIHNEFTLPRNRISSFLIRNKILRELVRTTLPRENEKGLRSILTKKTEKPTMRTEERKFAENLYYEDIIKLEKILGRKLPWFTPKN